MPIIQPVGTMTQQGMANVFLIKNRPTEDVILVIRVILGTNESKFGADMPCALVNAAMQGSCTFDVGPGRGPGTKPINPIYKEN